MALLSVNSDAKTTKGKRLGWLTGILYLAPGKLSGHQVCPMASKGCLAACLFTAGRGCMANVMAARIAKTRRFFEDRAGFLADLHKDIGALVRKAHREGLQPAVRLNGTSDIPWERIAPDLFERWSAVQFYDYSKRLNRKDLPPNYHLTVSRSETNEAEALASGHNVATVFAGQDLPERWRGRAVVDGDVSDLRFLDPPDSIVGLRAKGKARHDATGFVVQC